VEGITLLCLSDDTSLAIKDSAFTTLRQLGRDAKTTAGSKTSRATGRLDRYTLTALSDRSRRTLGRRDRDANIVSELSSGRATGFLRRVASLSLGVVLHTRTTTGVLL
jgi:hypothetical protein